MEKKKGRKPLGLSDSAKKLRKKEQDRSRQQQNKSVLMNVDTHARWVSLAERHGITSRQLAVVLLDAVDEGKLPFDPDPLDEQEESRRMMADKKIQKKMIKKEITEEPEPSEELGYQTYRVKEKVFEEEWMVDDGGQELLTEPVEQYPETQILAEAKSIGQQPETQTLTKEKSREQQPETKILTEAKSIEQRRETSLLKEEELEDGWIADSEATKICQDAPSEESVDNAYHTDSLQEEETESAKEADYEMYYVTEEHLESDCTEVLSCC